MRIRLSVALAFGLAVAAPKLGAQAEPQPTPPPMQTFEVEASRVQLDVVVRDKHDNPVTDLEKSDFEVYEDGVPQQVDIFRVVRPPAVATAPEEVPEGKVEVPAAGTTPERPPDVAAIAFVFDRLSPGARREAFRAALTYLEEGRRAHDYVGVFAIDLSLLTLQPYTDDAERIRAALEEGVGRAGAQYASSRQRQRDIVSQTEALDRQAAPAGTGSGPGAGAGAGAAGLASGAAAAQAALLAIEARMNDRFELLERDQQGYATSNGLLAVVNSMRLLPGRKTVVFFSEGLSIPPAVEAHFRAVISEANRASVSIYAMDVAGLRTDSPMAETRREMLAAASEQMRRSSSGRDFLGGPMSKQLERNEDLLRLNPHSGMGQLAGETGGFLVHDTNDLKAGFRRIDADMRFHYVLAYEPTDQEYDGRFRKIDVKVRRPGVEVRARKGYYAIRRTDDRPVLPFEAPAVALLDRAPDSNAFPAWARGLSFPDPERPGLAPIVVEVPGNVLTFTSNEDPKEPTYLARFVVLARIKDENGRMIDRISQNYELSGPLDGMKIVRGGPVLFYRELSLPPGHFTVETIVYDALAGSATVRSSPLVVPSPVGDHLRLSSVVRVKRVEQVPEAERNPANPFSFGEILVYPGLGEPIRKVPGEELAFFFTVYSVQGGAPEATLDLLQDGTRVARVPVELPAPDATGRIQHVLGLPLAQLPDGSYELRVAVKDGRGEASRTVDFTVESE